MDQQRESVNRLNQEKTRLETKLSSCQTELDKAQVITRKFLGNEAAEGEVNPEVQVSDHLRNRITELIDSLNVADSKAVMFQAECNRLQQRLVVAEEEVKSTHTELVTGKQAVQELREDLNTNVRNYETQLSTMSEHLATMNEKLTTQRDEIDALKLQLKNKKTKNK
jgi:protein phosphatase 1 regulatory subunit 21